MTLARFASGVLDESIADEVCAHLEDCSRCQKVVDDMAQREDSLIGAIRTEVSALDPEIPVANVELMDTYVHQAMGPTRFALTLIGVFGAIALVLASIGLYGVLSYVVRQRTAEIR